MGLTTTWVRYGRGAAEALRAAVAAAKGDEPLAPVTVVVPSNHVGVASRRLLASGALGPACGRGVGLAAVTFVTPYRLAELLGAPGLAAAGRRPVSTPVIAAALRAALTDQPGLFGPVAAHPATESALVAAYRELRDVSTGALDSIARTSARAADVVRIHRAARDRLAPEWYDEEDLMLAAASALRADPRAARDLGAVIVYLPQRLSRHAASLLESVAGAVKIGVSVLAGTTGSARADADVLTSVARLGASLLDLAPEPFDANAVVALGRTRFVTASDADDEVRAAVRAVMDAVRAGTPLDRIAILHASPEPYARLVHEQLSAAGIPANGASVVPLAARVAGRSLLQLLALPEGGFRRQEVFAWLASAPVRQDGQWAPVTSWERVSREAAVVRGRQDWDERLTRFADDRETRAKDDESDPDAPEWRAERNRREAAQSRALREFALRHIDDLDHAVAKPRSWSEHARWARHLLDSTLGGVTRRAEWPAAERKAAEKVEQALDRLGALDAVEGPVGLDVFTRTLELELESDLGRVGRFGDGVLVGSAGMGVGLDLELVIVLGLAEGSFPAQVHDDSLLPDHEREAAGDELPLRRQRVDREHRELLAALAGANQHLLCVPRGDLRKSSERVPSRWALDFASMLAGTRWWSGELLEARSGWVEHVASFDAGIRSTAFPATEQEHRLRSLLATGPRPAAIDPFHARGAEVISSRRSSSFTRFDGNLSGLTIPSPAERVMSPTRLERWAACPFNYLLQVLLNVEPVENPEEELRITAIDRGKLVHAALERFILEVLARPDSERPSPVEAWSADDRARMAAIAEGLFVDFEDRGLTGRPIFWRQDRKQIVADLLRFLTEDDRHRASTGTRPFAAELAFGFGSSSVGAVPLTLADGKVVRFRGQADRVDLDSAGGIHIIDYKTGSRRAPQPSDDDPDIRGRKLQLAVYGVAARVHQAMPDAPVRAEYWWVSKKGEFKRDGYWLTPEILERVGETLATMVRGIEAGVFPNYSTEVSTRFFVECASCDPDALGTTELRRSWERKRSDPALVVFADLADPLDAEVAVDGDGTGD